MCTVKSYLELWLDLRDFAHANVANVMDEKIMILSLLFFWPSEPLVSLTSGSFWLTRQSQITIIHATMSVVLRGKVDLNNQGPRRERGALKLFFIFLFFFTPSLLPFTKKHLAMNLSTLLTTLSYLLWNLITNILCRLDTQLALPHYPKVSAWPVQWECSSTHLMEMISPSYKQISLNWKVLKNPQVNKTNLSFINQNQTLCGSLSVIALHLHTSMNVGNVWWV